MKRTIFFFILALLMASCATHRKNQETTTHIETLSTVKEESKNETEKVVDTTKTERGKIVITEIFFDTTPTDSGEDARASPDNNRVEAKKPNHPARVTLTGVGEVNGNIKAIRQTIIEAEREAKAQISESGKQMDSKSNANAMDAVTTSKTEVQPMPVKSLWRFFPYVLGFAAVVLLYLKRMPIVNWIKIILSGLRRIF